MLSGISACSLEEGPGPPLESPPMLVYSQAILPYLTRKASGALVVPHRSSASFTSAIRSETDSCVNSTNCSGCGWHPLQVSKVSTAKACPLTSGCSSLTYSSVCMWQVTHCFERNAWVAGSLGASPLSSSPTVPNIMLYCGEWCGGRLVPCQVAPRWLWHWAHRFTCGSYLLVCLLYTSDAADERSSVDLG